MLKSRSSSLSRNYWFGALDANALQTGSRLQGVDGILFVGNCHEGSTWVGGVEGREVSLKMGELIVGWFDCVMVERRSERQKIEN